MLKYASRDSVELLGRGKAGVHEARSAIAEYQDASPLYGLIIYRRRKVLIKYIPEGTSRLLQGMSLAHPVCKGKVEARVDVRSQPEPPSISRTSRSAFPRTRPCWRLPRQTA